MMKLPDVASIYSVSKPKETRFPLAAELVVHVLLPVALAVMMSVIRLSTKEQI